MRYCGTSPTGVLAVGSVETLAFVDFNDAEKCTMPFMGVGTAECLAVTAVHGIQEVRTPSSQNGGVGTAGNPSGIRETLDFPTPKNLKAVPTGFEPVHPP